MIKYPSVLLKLSGEALMGKQNYGIDPGPAHGIYGTGEGYTPVGVNTGIVIGGGNMQGMKV
ncbi:MAG: hypothetical protein U0T82_15980 [Bacteroidales bacterium]